jgi:hypothetical protein
VLVRNLLLIGGLLCATGLQAQTLPSAPKPHVRFDHGVWAKADWLAAAFDSSTTGLTIVECQQALPHSTSCRERDPLAWPVEGKTPGPGHLALGWSLECTGTSLIPNRKLRRVVQFGAIAVHLYFGAHNLKEWH